MLQMEADDVNNSACVATTTSSSNNNNNKNNIETSNNHSNTVNEVQSENLNTTTTSNNNCNKSLVIIPKITEVIVEGPHNSHETIQTDFPSSTLLTTTTTTTTVNTTASVAAAASLTSPLLFSTTALTHVSSAPSLQQKEVLCSQACESNVVHRSQSNASVIPNKKMMVRLSIDNSSSASLRRRVSFPKYDTELVTGYLEPANPWQHSLACEHIDEVTELYESSCRKHNTTPLRIIQDHLKAVKLNKGVRQPLLCLKSIKLAPNDCEALEEIFKRVQYKSIDLSCCDLDESAASALFEMIEYYEATNELDISSNVKGLTHRGWVSCTYMISHSRALQVLKAQGNPISKLGAESLGHALTTSNLHVLKLEHCGLKGMPLSALCLKLRNNRILKELWLAYNDLDCLDADSIADLLKVNYYIELIDISNNNIQDVGLKSIVRALLIQTAELERRAKDKREEAENEHRNVAFEVGDSVDNDDEEEDMEADENIKHYENTQQDKLTNEQVVSNNDENELKEQQISQHDNGQNVAQCDEDDNDVKLHENIKNSTQGVGLSMLDKLLSMNSTTEESADLQLETQVEQIIDTSVDLPHRNENIVETNQILVDLSETVGNDTESTLLDVKIPKEDEEDETKRIKAMHDNMKTFKNSEEFDDTHSTDSAFESASEGDISRHLSEEYTRSTASVGTSETGIETGIIATELPENLLLDLDIPATSMHESKHVANVDTVNCYLDTRPLTSVAVVDSQSEDGETISGSMEKPLQTVCEASVQPTSAIANELMSHVVTPTSITPPIHTLMTARSNDIDIVQQAKYSSTASPIASPASYNMRRNESACGFITQASRNYSQSTDSLCSDNSLDGSLNSNDYGTNSQLNEKLTKNDTLTRQQRPMGIPLEIYNNTPSGLKALAIWNNNLTKEAGLYISDLLASTESLELLNIGKNCLSNEFFGRIKDQLTNNKTLTTLGLQSAHLSEQGIEKLISILTFGGNNTLQRIDIRDNKLTVESLLKIEEVLKSNTTIMQIDIDDEPKRLSVGTEEHQNYMRILQNIRSMCARNEQNMIQNANKLSKTVEDEGNASRRTCYAGARKISLTCYNRTFIDAVLAKNQSMNNAPTSSANLAVHKMEAKRKTGCRLRSPVPSPGAISPSSSPNRSSRFQVFRVSEPSPTVAASTSFNAIVSTKTPSPVSPLTGMKSSADMSINQVSGGQTFSCSPRSRFQVRRIYEDPKIPLVQRALPPITPPLNLPPTPLSKNVPKNEIHLKASSPPMKIVVQDLSNTGNISYASVLKQKDVNSAVKTVEFSDVTTTIHTKIGNIKKQEQLQLERDETDASETSSSPSSSTSSHSSSSTSSVFPPQSQATTETIPSISDVYCDDNEATLTGNSDYIKTTADEHVDLENNGINHNNNNKNNQQNIHTLTTDESVRKSSWIANPATVDKLLNIFQNPAAFFQRSMSPEPKDVTSSTPAFNPNSSDCNMVSTFPVHKSTHWQTETFPLTPAGSNCGKQQSSSSSSSTSPVPWGSNRAEIAKTLATTAAAATLVQSRSFLDNASRQFKDLSKQVFGPNFPLTLDHKSSATPADHETITTTDFSQHKTAVVNESGALKEDDNSIEVSSTYFESEP